MCLWRAISSADSAPPAAGVAACAGVGLLLLRCSSALSSRRATAAGPVSQGSQYCTSPASSPHASAADAAADAASSAVLEALLPGSLWVAEDADAEFEPEACD